MIEVTSQEQFEKLVEDNDVVLADFAAPAWCQPCLKFAPHFEMASEKSDAVFAHIDIDYNEWASKEYGILSVPTVMLFKNGRYVRHVKARTALLLLKELE